MSLSPGTRLGHYDVTSLLGEGGMGQVWQATDTQLNRQVALKILPDAFAADPDRLARFQREAQVLASLNHPNIAAIHGIEKSDDTQALVLELVDGPTLADRIAKGPIPVDEALPIAKQIAEALEAAHEAGVIHRDLKPANIKIREDGTVKVLDFGLAKAIAGEQSNVDLSQSPTMTATMGGTREGVILGTAAYMSPEQARGKPLDKRTDIWSFGCVLFEMVTGRRAFNGDTIPDVVAALLKVQPDWDWLPGDTPASVERLLRRCLAKEPIRRVPNAAAARFDIEELLASGDGVDAPHSAAPDRSSGWLPLAATLVVVVALLVVVSVWLAGRSPQGSRARFVVSAGPNPAPWVANPGVRISRDGSMVVYFADVQGQSQLYARPVDRLDGELLEGSTSVRWAALSPEGAWVAFTTVLSQTLSKVQVVGGAVTPIAPLGSAVRGISWGDDDTIVFATTDPSGLWRVAANGGQPSLITAAGGSSEHQNHILPWVLPGANAVLFTLEGADRALTSQQIAVADLRTGEWEVILTSGSSPRYISSGHLLYQESDSLWAVAFDIDQLKTAGAPTPVLVGAEVRSFAVSDSGTLVYGRGGADSAEARRTLVWMDRDGREDPLPAEPGPYVAVRLSPDGERLAAELHYGAANAELVIFDDLDRASGEVFTFYPGRDSSPVWSPDGDRVAFASTRDDSSLSTYWKAVDGAGGAVSISADVQQTPSAFVLGGEALFVSQIRAGNGSDVGILSLDGSGTIDWVLDSTAHESNLSLSPNGRWVAYTSDETGDHEVWVRPFPMVDGTRWRVSTGGGRSPRWGADSRELFYQTPAAQGAPTILSSLNIAVGSTLMVAKNETEPTFSPGEPVELFDGPFLVGVQTWATPYDVSASSQRFLMIKEDPSAGLVADEPTVVAVLDWVEELERIVPTP